MPEPPKRELFPADPELAHGATIVINARCLVKAGGRRRVALVTGMPIAGYALGDAMAEAHAMVSLIEPGWADQNDVAGAFGRSERTVRRYQRRFEDSGLVALGRPGGYPRGRPRLGRTRPRLVSRLRGEGKSVRQIADRVGVSEKAIRRQLRRLGWPAGEPVPATLALSGPAANPKLPGSAASSDEAAGTPGLAVDPTLSGSAVLADDEPLVISADRDPVDRSADRLLAALGLLEDAAPLFRDGEHVARAGV